MHENNLKQTNKHVILIYENHVIYAKLTVLNVVDTLDPISMNMNMYMNDLNIGTL